MGNDKFNLLDRLRIDQPVDSQSSESPENSNRKVKRQAIGIKILVKFSIVQLMLKKVQIT
jgi:hypothetical protein